MNSEEESTEQFGEQDFSFFNRKKIRGVGRIELPTSRTRSENHTTRPNTRFEL